MPSSTSLETMFDEDPHGGRSNSKNFRLEGKALFLTWPQCSTPKEIVLSRLSKIEDFSHGIVCRENHKDDAGVHLHAFVVFKTRFRMAGKKCLNFFDAIAKSHGNYQVARKQLAVCQYVMKDGDYVSSGFDPVSFVANLKSHKKGKGVTKATQYAEMLRDGKTVMDLDDIDPGWVMNNKRKAEEYIMFCNQKKLRASLLPWPGIDADAFTEDHDVQIASWVLSNIKTKREFKQKQLYIYSDGPDVGKTTFVSSLAKYLATFHLPKNAFVDGYVSNHFDLVVCDEFSSQFTITFLNEFLQGSTMHLNQKGTGTIKTDNPPIIILSNRSPEAVYHKLSSNNDGRFAALLSRLLVVEVPMGRKINVLYENKK